MEFSGGEVARVEGCLTAIADLGEPPHLRERLEAIERSSASAGDDQAVHQAVLILIADAAPSHALVKGQEIVDDLASRDQLVRSTLQYLEIKPQRGWTAAARRGRALDSFLHLLTMRLLRLAAIEEPLDLLLRGSGGQGIPTMLSDIDFEVSGPGKPSGHLQIEKAIVVLLAGLGLDAEGSSGRPTHSDLKGKDGSYRELHEWMELRKAGQLERNPGWVAQAFDNLPGEWWRQSSTYELEGRRVTPKYAFFEARALTARLSLLHATCAGTTRAQLRALRQLGLDRPVMQIEHAIAGALDLYERPEAYDEAKLRAIQCSLDKIRQRFDLPGPDLSRPSSPDTRRESMAFLPQTD